MNNKAIASAIALVVVIILIFLFKQFSYLGEEQRNVRTLNPERHIEDLAGNFDLWNKIINSDDPNDLSNMSWSEHIDLSIEEKIGILRTEKMDRINEYLHKPFL
jgi:hypothetical protein